MPQIALWQNETKQTLFVPDVPLDRLRISDLNPRKHRDANQVKSIAQLITEHGFDKTCAPKAIARNGHYEVFAGGNRLMAAIDAGCASIPIYLFDGYTEDEIWNLAYLDNEQAAKHNRVSDVDVWLDYAEKGKTKTQAEIASILKVSQSQVSRRIRCAGFPQSVLEIIHREYLTEKIAFELLNLNAVNNPYWFTWEEAALEVIEAAIRKGGTSKNFADLVAQYNAFIELAQTFAGKLEEPWRNKFRDELVTVKARTKPAVEAAYGRIVEAQRKEAQRKAEELARQQNEAEADRLRLEREAEQNRRIAAIMANLVHGDARTAIQSAPDGIKLVLTDPPYGQDFQSNRRVASAKAPKLANDNDQAFGLLCDVLTEAYKHMADDSTLLVWSSWRYECEFRQIVTACGFTIKGSLIWDKPNHGSGDLEGSFAPKHERIIHAVKGTPKLNRRHDDVLRGGQFLGTEHPTEKPLDLLTMLIEATTNEGDVVADPFAGSGSTVIAAHQTRRKFWACELDEDWFKTASSQLYDLVKQEA